MYAELVKSSCRSPYNKQDLFRIHFCVLMLLYSFYKIMLV